MVVPTLQADDPAADGSRWASMRTSLPEEWLKRIWLLWIFGASLSACWSGFIMLFILARRRLRSSIVNQFVVGLALSDFIFSFLCSITCALHYAHSRYFGGNLMCVTQSLYCIYGFAASIWMNIVIAHELHRMASCPHQLKSYRPLPGHVVRRRILAVHLAAVAFSSLSFMPGLPTDVGAFSGLACLPMEYDVPSTIWHWLVTMNLMLVSPLVVLMYYFGRVYLLVFRQPDADSKDQAVVKFFLTLLVIFVGMWLNTGVLIWVIRIDGAGEFDGIGGFISHLQGFMSAIIYVAKPDIREELRLCCISCWRMVTAGESFTRVSAVVRRREGSVHSKESGGSSVSSDSLAVMVKELGMQVERKIRSLEQAPMRVVELKTWMQTGHFPRSSEQLARRLEESDVVIFISHRWWGDAHPDDGENSKYQILCRGIQHLITRHRLKAQDVVIWCDWACIEQDNAEALRKGVSSLITYAARSNFVLIPVASEPRALGAAQAAKHPNFLWNYGERAWCRLEVYIFSCAAEVAGRPAHIYCFSPRSRGLRDRLGLPSETLSRLEGTFDASMLPSEGLLSREEDRAAVKSVESEMRSIYVRNAVLKEQLHVFGRKSQCTFQLAERQLECAHAPMLVSALLDPSLAPRLRALVLDGNLLSDTGVTLLVQEVVCSPCTLTLSKLSLSNNPRLGAEGVRQIALALLDPHCCLETLRLGSCGLDGDSIRPLVVALQKTSTLRYLDLSHNRLDDATVEELLSAAGGCERPRAALDVEGNRISVGLFLRVARAGRALELGRASTVVSGGARDLIEVEERPESELERGLEMLAGEKSPGEQTATTATTGDASPSPRICTSPTAASLRTGAWWCFRC